MDFRFHKKLEQLALMPIYFATLLILLTDEGALSATQKRFFLIFLVF